MLLCSECVMRRRIASIERDGSEPDPAVASSTLAKPPRDGLPTVFEAQVLMQGTGLCHAHLAECVQIQRQSAIAGPNGQPFILPANGTPR